MAITLVRPTDVLVLAIVLLDLAAPLGSTAPVKIKFTCNGLRRYIMDYADYEPTGHHAALDMKHCKF